MPLFRTPKIQIALPASTDDPSRGKAMLEYFGHLSARLQQMTVSAQQFIYFSGLTAGAIVSAGMVGHKPLVLVLAPYALTLVIVYQIQLYTDVECLTTIKEHLEAELNKNLAVRMYLESSVLTPQYRNRPSIRLVQLIYIALMVSVFAQSMQASYEMHIHWRFRGLRFLPLHSVDTFYVHVFGLVVCLLLLTAAGLELMRAHDMTCRSIEEALGSRDG